MLILPEPERGPSSPFRLAWRAVRAWLIGVVFTVALAAVIEFPILPVGQIALEVGDVATRDVRSPRRATYVSDLQTEDARKRAEASVAPIYTLPDGRVARQQIARARAVADFIRAVRADSYATLAQKQTALAAIQGISLSSAQAERTVTLPDETWSKIETEVVNVLDVAMRSEIREDDVGPVRARIPGMVGIRLTEEQAALAGPLAQQFIAPNSFLDAEATANARAKARQSVEPVARTYEAGEIIVREGQSVTSLDVEALDRLGLRQPKSDWGDLASATLHAVMFTIVLGLYLQRFEAGIGSRPRNLALLSVLILIFAVAAKAMITGRTVLPYVFPAAALPMLLAVLAGPHLAIIVASIFGILVGTLSGGSLELGVYAAAGGLVAALVLRRVERLDAFFRAGLYVALFNVAVILAFRLPGGVTDAVGIVTLVIAGIVNGVVAASLSIGGLYLIGSLFDVTTTLQLLELSRPHHPLLQLLLMKAPGTYHHTLMVATLAEQAAERIGADTLLVRVGAFYHDVGKTIHPYMFVENQMEGSNIHEKLEARTSAEIITRHIEDGLTLARRYRLPSRIRAFIPEHHGTMRISFLYQKAVQQAGGDASKVNEQTFRYPGPKPQSKEAALVMLADGCEAAVRAARSASVEETGEIVRKVIADRAACDQLTECSLTFQDLKLIRESFTLTLQGMFHPRIQYPDAEELQARRAGR
jgi:cyclic-di-AMP phosphodiesterase PgpH